MCRRTTDHVNGVWIIGIVDDGIRLEFGKQTVFASLVMFKIRMLALTDMIRKQIGKDA